MHLTVGDSSYCFVADGVTHGKVKYLDVAACVPQCNMVTLKQRDTESRSQHFFLCVCVCVCVRGVGLMFLKITAGHGFHFFGVFNI